MHLLPDRQSLATGWTDKGQRTAKENGCIHFSLLKVTVFKKRFSIAAWNSFIIHNALDFTMPLDHLVMNMLERWFMKKAICASGAFVRRYTFAISEISAEHDSFLRNVWVSHHLLTSNPELCRGQIRQQPHPQGLHTRRPAVHVLNVQHEDRRNRFITSVTTLE